ncbi:NADP-dependent oxidoreductase domain-containing protein [Kockovaella imperatae]|uniref:NADP-dependent oxidoreductase domain-containing protein n=1 Tax=Kockovaella imperatae TaxID=4999 RepID=A0A1Y1UJC0_9TREE|nr:NADP-dependent oxidoreductase domain-containing protein [Kockovaella imperatae]ORX38069.1 NADP-dependent oxidoreductase domain-containing protein [Kockovaella imperatae]
MPWRSITLPNGSSIPQIAFGSAPRRSEGAQVKSVDNLTHAIRSGFRHIDTAQQYGNEDFVGAAIQASGLPRHELWITTKWSDGNKSPEESCRVSLSKLGLDYIDLYIVHHEWTCQGDFAGSWRRMEDLAEKGLVRNIGLSAFGLEKTREILQHCRIKPAVNMILFHPNVLKDTLPLLACMKQHGIALGAYSVCKPLWQDSQSSLLPALEDIAGRYQATADQILLSWARAKDAIIFTSSTSNERMQGYMQAGDVILDDEDVRRIDRAGQNIRI